jgi:hypothetical protein
MTEDNKGTREEGEYDDDATSNAVNPPAQPRPDKRPTDGSRSSSGSSRSRSRSHSRPRHHRRRSRSSSRERRRHRRSRHDEESRSRSRSPRQSRHDHRSERQERHSRHHHHDDRRYGGDKYNRYGSKDDDRSHEVYISREKVELGDRRSYVSERDSMATSKMERDKRDGGRHEVSSRKQTEMPLSPVVEHNKQPTDAILKAQDMELIRSRYLGKSEERQLRRNIRPGEKKFLFDWDPTEDTSAGIGHDLMTAPPAHLQAGIRAPSAWQRSEPGNSRYTE